MSAAPATAPGRPGTTRPGLGGRRRLAALRPPAALTPLLGVAALLGIAWTLVTPAFQAPDENTHFGYVQSLAERFAMPGDPTRAEFSSEQALASSASNGDQVAANPFARMEWSKDGYARWRAADAALPPADRRNGGGPNPAQSNPPLYYLYEAAPYRLVGGGDVFTRLQVARLGSVVWMLVAVVGVWLLAGEAFSRNRLLQLAAAGTAALAPMIGFVSASLNPDAMLYASWSLALWLGLRLLSRGLTAGRAAALLVAVGAACVVKATSYALLPGAALVLAVALHRAAGHRRRLTGLAAAAAGLLLTIGAWVLIAHVNHRAAAGQVTGATAGAGSSLNLRELLSYLGQFYLPSLPFPHDFPLYDIWLKQVWGAFGWALEVSFPGWLYVVLALITVGVAGIALAGLWRGRRTVDWAAVAFIAVTGLALLAGVHWTEYRHLAEFNNSGRYLLPMVGVAGLAVAQTTRMLRPGRQGAAVAVTLGGLFALDVYSLGLVLVRFYA
jgi:4-amino-4-deoxy-L-arabinose transferase-like glycosyltransferase